MFGGNIMAKFYEVLKIDVIELIAEDVLQASPGEHDSASESGAEDNEDWWN